MGWILSLCSSTHNSDDALTCLPIARSTPHRTEAVAHKQLILGLHLPYAAELCQNAQFVNPIWHAASLNTSRRPSIKQHNTLCLKRRLLPAKVTRSVCRHVVSATERLTDKINCFLFQYSYKFRPIIKPTSGFLGKDINKTLLRCTAACLRSIFDTSKRAVLFQKDTLSFK
jgi:hypothetical protein